MEHIVKTYILLLFSLLVSSIGYAQEENDIIYIQEGKWGVILCGERGYAWLDNKGDTIFGFGITFINFSRCLYHMIYDFMRFRQLRNLQFIQHFI